MSPGYKFIDSLCLYIILKYQNKHYLSTSRVLKNLPQFSHTVMSDSTTPWTEACQASLSITNSWSLLRFKSIELVMPSNFLIFCCPFCLQSFPASGSFTMSPFFTSGGKSIRVSPSASVLPINIQD